MRCQVVSHGQDMPVKLVENRFQDRGNAMTRGQDIQDERWSNGGGRGVKSSVSRLAATAAAEDGALITMQ